MTSPSLMRRMERLEASRPVSASALWSIDQDEAARCYAASLDETEEINERERAYLASATLLQLAADYDQILRGGPAPWAGR